MLMGRDKEIRQESNQDHAVDPETGLARLIKI